MRRVRSLLFVCLSLALCGEVIAQTEAASADVKPGETITNSIGMKLVLIPAGEFRMGSDDSLADLERAFGELPDNFEPEMLAAEHPVHQVKIAKPFYLGAFEVTKVEFRKFVEADQYKSEAERDGQGCPGWNVAEKKLDWKNDYSWRDWGAEQGDDHPVVNVSWNDARAFCQWLSDREGKTYRLPTEAEWEYACRAGTRTEFYNGDSPEELTKIGNVPDAALLAKTPTWPSTVKANDAYAFTAPVGKFRANPFGLFDMAGNVSEWCLDAYAVDYYARSTAQDPQGPSFDGFRVVRGGGWNFYPLDCRSARRIAIQPEYRNPNIGYRVVLQRPVEPSSEVAQKPAVEPRAGDVMTNSLGMKLALIPSGEFQMGSDEKTDELEQAFEITDFDEAMLERLAGFPEFSRPKDYAAEGPAHRVKISKPFYMGVYEVTKRQFRRFVAAAEYRTDAEKDGKGGWLWVQQAETLVQKPEYAWRTWEADQGYDHPVVNVSWNDAKAFCAWLSAKEGKRYRLPTEAEWEYACRAGADTRFYNGDDPSAPARIGNVRGFRLEVVSRGKLKPNITKTHLTPKPKDGYVLTAPVGQFRRNRFGLFDMTGNVSEWCDDWFAADYYGRSPGQDPPGPADGKSRVLRGGGWDSAPLRCRSAFRSSAAPADRYGSIGFRVVLETDVQPLPLPVAAVSGDDVGAAPAIETTVNALGMKLARIPAGEFAMGGDESLAELKEAFVTPDFFQQQWFAAERPVHRVRITRPFLMGVYEVTNGEFGKFVEAAGYKTEAERDGKGGFGLKEGKIAQSPEFTWRSWGLDRGDDCPVVNVTWNDAVAFCKWLSEQEGKHYRLPTEAEWEYACRAGTETRFYNGDDPKNLVQIGNVPDATFKQAFTATDFAVETKDGFVLTAPVGRFGANRFGLYDMTGNVSEWCSDWCDTDYYSGSPKEDPAGPPTGSTRVIRGGGWVYFPILCRSSARISDQPSFRRLYTGFRVVCEE